MIGVVWMGLVGAVAAEPPMEVVLFEAVRREEPRYVAGPLRTCVAMVQIEDGAARRVSVTDCSWPRAVEVFRALEGWSWSERGASEPLSSGRSRVPVRFGATPGWTVPLDHSARAGVTVFGLDGRTLTWSSEDLSMRVLEADLERPELPGACSFSVEEGGLVPLAVCPDPLSGFAKAWFERARVEGIETWTILAALPEPSVSDR